MKPYKDRDPDVVKGELIRAMMGPLFRALDAEGITDEVLAKKLREELEAKEERVFQYKGEVVKSDPLVAWEVRQRARQDAHKLRGDYPAERVQHEVETTVEVINYSEVKKE